MNQQIGGGKERVFYFLLTLPVDADVLWYTSEEYKRIKSKFLK